MSQLSSCRPSPWTASLAYVSVHFNLFSAISVQFTVVQLELALERFLDQCLTFQQYLSASWGKYLATLENGNNTIINLMYLVGK